MSIRLVEGSAYEMIGESWSLLEQHVDELTTNKDIMILKPDAERYRMMEESGMLFSIFAYDGDSLVGYSVNFLSNHLHYADLKYAQNDVLFVAKPYRNGRTGFSLIRRTEEVAKDRGAQLLVWHAKPNTALEQLLPRVGYKVQDIMMMKGL